MGEANQIYLDNTVGIGRRIIVDHPPLPCTNKQGDEATKHGHGLD